MYLLHDVDTVLVLLPLKESVYVEEEGPQVILSVSIRHNNGNLNNAGNSKKHKSESKYKIFLCYFVKMKVKENYT